jgi:hypothetical protein
MNKEEDTYGELSDLNLKSLIALTSSNMDTS